jgi:hypothetical protein
LNHLTVISWPHLHPQLAQSRWDYACLLALPSRDYNDIGKLHGFGFKKIKGIHPLCKISIITYMCRYELQNG